MMLNSKLNRLFVLLTGISALTTKVASNVILPESNRSFPSVPADFGLPFSLVTDGTVKTAYLQMIDQWSLLCSADDDGNAIQYDPEVVVTPDDGTPVALLVERGSCTFFEKGKVASQWNPPVEYVIVYDNAPEQELITMTTESNETLDMTLFYVSYETGNELKALILQQRNETFVDDGYTTNSSFGVLIALDGESPAYGYSPFGAATTFRSAATACLSLFIAACFCLSCAQAGLFNYSRDENGRLILFFARTDIGTTPVKVNNHSILTRDQANKLDEEVFRERENATGEEGVRTENTDVEAAKCICAICLEEFEDNEKVKVLPCHHRFHIDCLVPWLTRRHASCPLCKFDVLEHIQKSQLASERNKTSRNNHTQNTETVDTMESNLTPTGPDSV